MTDRTSNSTPCYMAHMIDGEIPYFGDCEEAKKYEGKVCDCGKLKVIVEYCWCPNCPEKTKFVEND